MVAVAVTALIPTDDTPTRSGNQRREDVVRAGEVEPTMDEEQRWRSRVAPFVHRNADLARMDLVLAGGCDGTWVVPGLTVVWSVRGGVHGDESTRTMVEMSHPTVRPASYRARIGALLALATVGVLAACGSSATKASDTLPPIATTTTTTTMPPTTTTIPSSYVIQKGESLSGIAKMFGLSTSELAAYNGIVNMDDIQAGQTLKIPQPGESIPTTVPVATVDPAAQTSTT